MEIALSPLAASLGGRGAAARVGKRYRFAHVPDRCRRGAGPAGRRRPGRPQPGRLEHAEGPHRRRGPRGDRARLFDSRRHEPVALTCAGADGPGGAPGERRGRLGRADGGAQGAARARRRLAAARRHRAGRADPAGRAAHSAGGAARRPAQLVVRPRLGRDCGPGRAERLGFRHPLRRRLDRKGHPDLPRRRERPRRADRRAHHANRRRVAARAVRRQGQRRDARRRGRLRGDSGPPGRRGGDPLQRGGEARRRVRARAAFGRHLDPPGNRLDPRPAQGRRREPGPPDRGPERGGRTLADGPDAGLRGPGRGVAGLDGRVGLGPRAGAGRRPADRRHGQRPGAALRRPPHPGGRAARPRPAVRIGPSGARRGPPGGRTGSRRGAVARRLGLAGRHQRPPRALGRRPGLPRPAGSPASPRCGLERRRAAARARLGAAARQLGRQPERQPAGRRGRGRLHRLPGSRVGQSARAAVLGRRRRERGAAGPPEADEPVGPGDGLGQTDSDQRSRPALRPDPGVGRRGCGAAAAAGPRHRPGAR